MTENTETGKMKPDDIAQVAVEMLAEHHPNQRMVVVVLGESQHDPITIATTDTLEPFEAAMAMGDAANHLMQQQDFEADADLPEGDIALGSTSAADAIAALGEVGVDTAERIVIDYKVDDTETYLAYAVENLDYQVAIEVMNKLIDDWSQNAESEGDNSSMTRVIH